MPVASRFKALGAGNGFPFCLNKRDVSFFADKAPMTLAQAMSIYWKMYGVDCKAEASSTFGGSVSAQDINLDDDNIGGPTEYEPEDRICITADNTIQKVDSFIYESVALTSTVKIEMVRMYDGNVNDEANFIGYGVIGGLTRFARAAAFSEDGGSVFGESIIELSSYRTAPSGWQQQAITLSGIPFVCSMSCNINGVDGTFDFSVPSCSASGSDVSTYAEITAIENYTFS